MDRSEKEEASPILKSWRNVYALVIGVLTLAIIGMYLFMQYFK
ncbi:MAG: hypothetical protein PSX81_08155 [bacterium]|nr:hypothetical protein [bacterium]